MLLLLTATTDCYCYCYCYAAAALHAPGHSTHHGRRQARTASNPSAQALTAAVYVHDTPWITTPPYTPTVHDTFSYHRYARNYSPSNNSNNPHIIILVHASGLMPPVRVAPAARAAAAQRRAAAAAAVLRGSWCKAPPRWRRATPRRRRTALPRCYPRFR